MHNGEEQQSQVQAASSDGAGVKGATQEESARNHSNHKDLYQQQQGEQRRKTSHLTVSYFPALTFVTFDLVHMELHPTC